MRTFFGKGLAAAALVLALVTAGPALAAGDIAVGAVALEIAAVDQSGTARDLASLAPGKGVVLIFTRSLQW
ncbi:MAG: hypothetical protein VW644_03495 [Alphaproteobacteria bacterium]